MRFKTKIDNLGRVKIPKEIRNYLNLKKGSEVNIFRSGNNIIIKLRKKNHAVIKNKDGVLVVCSKLTGPSDKIIDKNRDAKLKKTFIRE